MNGTSGGFPGFSCSSSVEERRVLGTWARVSRFSRLRESFFEKSFLRILLAKGRVFLVLGARRKTADYPKSQEEGTF